MIDRQAVVAEARTWIGTRWQHQASLKGIGCDCIGLVAGVALGLGIEGAAEFYASPNLRTYGRAPHPALIEACDRLLDRVDLADTDLGDVLVMRFETEPQHFGIVSGVDPPYVVHAFAQARKVTEHRIDALWLSRILRTYRFRGVS